MDDLRKAAQAALEALEGPLVPSPAKRHKVLAGLRAALAQPEPWRDAIDEALIVRCLEPSRDDEMPMQALWRLIAWEVTIALDPAVSERAAALLAAQPEQQAAPAVFLPDRAELSDAWTALLDAGESPICEDDTVANAIRRLTGRSLTLTVSTDDTFHGNYRITDGSRSRGVTIARSDLADDMSDSDLRGLLSGACDDAAHQSIRVEPLDVEAFLKWAGS